MKRLYKINEKALFKKEGNLRDVFNIKDERAEKLLDESYNLWTQKLVPYALKMQLILDLAQNEDELIFLSVGIGRLFQLGREEHDLKKAINTNNATDTKFDITQKILKQ